MHPNDGRTDFDFLHGRWTVTNRRLRHRLQGNDQWDEFEAAVVNWPILGGIGNVDTFATTWPDGTAVNASSFRIFNPATGLWSIYWADDHRCELFPPTIGRFDDGVGHFEGDDTEGGLPVRVRFQWTDITSVSATWQQAFSADDGQTWETNWFMFFHRLPNT